MSLFRHYKQKDARRKCPRSPIIVIIILSNEKKDIAHRITVEDVVMVVIDKFVYVEQHRNEIDNEKNVKT